MANVHMVMYRPVNVAFLCVFGLLLGLAAHDAARPKADYAIKNPQPSVQEKDKDNFGDALPSGAVARLGCVRLRHASGIRTLAISPNGQFLASAAQKVRLWDSRNGKEIHNLAVFASCLTFSPCGKFLAIGHDNSLYLMRGWGKEPAITLWNIAEGKQIKTLATSRRRQPLTLTALVFSPDGKTLASADDSGVVSLWDVAGGKEIRQVDVPGDETYLLAFTPSGKTLVVGARGRVWDWQKPAPQKWGPGTIYVWDLDKQQINRRFIVDAKFFISELAMAADGKTLAIRSGWAAHLWDLSTGKKIRNLLEGSDIRAVALSPDGQTIALGCYQEPGPDREIGFVCVLETATGKERRRLDGFASCLVFTADNRLVGAGADHAIRVWDVQTGKGILPPGSNTHAVTCLAWGFPKTRGQKVETLVAGVNGGRVHVWNIATGDERWQRRLQFGFDHYAGFGFVAVGPSGRILAAPNDFPRGSGKEPTPVLWDVATGKALLAISALPDKSGTSRYVCPVAFSPDGKSLAVVKQPHTIQVWDVVAQKVRGQWNGPEKGIFQIAMSLNGRTLGALGTTREEGTGALLQLWNTLTGKTICRAQESIRFFALSPDGRFYAIQGKGVRICEAISGEEIFSLDQEPWVDALAFSWDNRVLAVASTNHRYEPTTIRVLDLAERKDLGKLIGHRGSITSLAFSPDGSKLASASADTTVLIWNVPGTSHSRPLAKDLTAEQLAKLWDDLAGDGARAFRAEVRLRASPKQAVGLVGQHLRPVADVPAQELFRLIAALNSDQFVVRNHAFSQLKRHGELAQPILLESLKKSPPLEQRRPLQELLSRLQVLSPPQLQASRAIALLEYIGSKEARTLLARLASGTPAAYLTQEAKTSLEQ